MLANILRNAAKAGYFSVMGRKVLSRLREPIRGADVEQRRAELTRRALDTEDWAGEIDAALWQEAETFAERHEAHARARIAELEVNLGGGGHYALLYFLIRWLKPKVVLETGVAAGHSSRACLIALRENGAGKLYSSDCPYFSMKDPERYIGWVVEDELKENWRLEIAGDRANLPVLLEAAGTVDLFHYDSDKSRAGRQFALTAVEPHLSPGAWMVFDDIQDNDHFFELERQFPGRTLIFRCRRKYVGVITPA